VSGLSAALTPHTLASGGDDGRLRVWDLRAFQAPVADFKHHRRGLACTSRMRKLVMLPLGVY